MDDLISRQAAIDAIHEDADWLAAQGSDWQVERMERDKSILKSLPSVEPERKTGKWIGYKADDKDWQRDDGSPIFMNCSECHEAVISNSSAHWNFCPNCGSKMER